MLVLLAFFSLLVTVPGIVAVPPIDRDEARFVQATKQMAESGDYLDIRFQDQVRYKKPIGIYWLQAAAVAVSGEGASAPIWVYRLVSVLGVLGAVLTLAWAGARLLGSQAGFVGGLVLATLFACAFEGRVAKTDAMLLFFSVAAQAALGLIYVAGREGRPITPGLPWLFWAAQGCGILIKGPITPLLAALTVATIVIFDRDRRWLRDLRPLPGVLLTLAIALPWLILITWKSGGAFWSESVGKDLLGKVASGEESHGAPPGYYVITYALFYWPFGVLGVAAGLLAMTRAKTDPRLLFCLAWYIPFWLAMELVPTKLPHYVLPAYPGLALLAGWASTLVPSPTRDDLWRWQRWLRLVAAFGHVAVTAGLAAAAMVLPVYVGSGWSFAGFLAALAVIAAGVLAFPREIALPASRIGLAAVSAAIAYALIFWQVLPSIDRMWLSPRIAAAVEANKTCDNATLAAVGFHEPSLVFLAGTATQLTDIAGAAAALAADPRCALVLSPTSRQAELSAAAASAGAIEALTTIEGVNYSSGQELSLGLYRVVR
ncbi:MAG: glycosyltransferase family 39 protein [Rhizobiaceae bacterium]|nr:glycosyltransferase family 39 protein [Rhizobiaceae bacterium]